MSAKLNARQRIINAAVDNHFNVSDRSRGSLLLSRGDVSVMVSFVASGTRISYADANRGDDVMWDAFPAENSSGRSFIASKNVADQVIELLGSARVV